MSLLLVLRYSKWDPTAARVLSSHQLSDLSGSDGKAWLARPFPGYWRCMRGFILWKPPANSSATSARTRIFFLSEDPNLASLSKTYWHGAYGRPNFPGEAHLRNKFRENEASKGCQQCYKAN